MSIRNCWIGCGRMCQDPVLRTTKDGKNVLYFTIAINEGTKEKPHVNYQDCVAYDSYADTISKFFHKGDQIFLEGRTNNYMVDDRGEKRKVCNITVTSFVFGQRKKENEEKNKNEENKIERKEIDDFDAKYEDFGWF